MPLNTILACEATAHTNIVAVQASEVPGESDRLPHYKWCWVQWHNLDAQRNALLFRGWMAIRMEITPYYYTWWGYNCSKLFIFHIITLVAIFLFGRSTRYCFKRSWHDFILKVASVHFNFTFIKLHKTNNKIKDTLSVRHIFRGTNLQHKIAISVVNVETSDKPGN